MLATPQDIPLACPFCGEDAFDALGLKLHLVNGDCEKFNALPTS